MEKKKTKASRWWHDKEHCRAAALECKTHAELRNKYPVMVRSAHLYGWYDELTSHMPPLISIVSKEECIEVAKRYKSRGELRSKEPRVYSAATNKGWLDEICAHMDGKIKRKAGYWDSLEHCKETALLYSSRPELRKQEKGCHDSILKHGWQKECFEHMNCRVKEYTYEQLESIAKRYSTFKDFRVNNIGAYHAAKTRGILDEICSHMPEHKVCIKYDTPLTPETCKEVALKFDTRSQFMKHESGRYYGYAQRNGLLDDVCAHMKVVGNKKKRCIYTATFEDDHSIYIGLTCNTTNRWNNHLREDNSAVYIHIQETGINPIFKKVTDYLPIEEAQKKEQEYIQEYFHKGWNVLNRAKGGALGGINGYSKEEVLEHAKRYTSLAEFRKKESGYYECGYRSDYWDEIRQICKPYTRIFTNEQLAEIASHYHTMKEFRKYDHAALDSAKKRGILDDICKHMDRSNERHKLTEEDLWNAALQCSSRYELQKKFKGAYCRMKKDGTLDKFCAHMKSSRIKVWTPTLIAKEAKKYKYRKEFYRYSQTAYTKARKLGILDDVCAHMVNRYSKNYTCTTIDDAIALAHQCNGRMELWKKYRDAYNMLQEKNMLDYIIPKNKRTSAWNKDKIVQVAEQCKTRTEFKTLFAQAYEIARETGILDEVCKHMQSMHKKKG